MNNLSSLNKTGIALAVAQALAFNVSSAATITVNNGADTTVGCSFREAIDTINQGNNLNNGCDADLADGGFGVNDSLKFEVNAITLSEGEVLIDSDVSINPNGSPVTITGNNTSRLLNVNVADVSIEELTLTGGSSTDFGGAIIAVNGAVLIINDSHIFGNSARTGGGISARDSYVVINNSVISENFANSAAIVSGAGVHLSNSTLSVDNSVISRNSASASGGGIIALDSTLNINNTVISENTSDFAGGGIRADSSQLTIDKSTISENSASDFGGGLSANSGSNLSLRNSTISANFADNGGGLISTGITAFISNTTISENTARLSGGAINALDSMVGLYNSTITQNVLGTTTARGGGIFASNNSTVTLSNSIVSGNRSNTISELALLSSVGIFNGNNLLGDNSRLTSEAFQGVTPSSNNILATSDGNTPTAISNILAPLADNGGPTLTHALVQGSPAVDAGDNNICATVQVNLMDQRGEPRPLGGTCDIGAFEGELEPEPNPTLFVVPLPNGKSVVFGL